ncbi:uncharacterized protein LOC115446286 [Manduca sexta]|uniref:uncharacterized protein LOC115446286 n=1 Tax=Manduca sexta TaxID=7130 RepID=UPI00188FF7FB|nr:uncharacterized protein LOC115446286 [Manduca sexta]
MSSLLTYILVVISVLCTITCVHSIMCYDCNSAYDPRCGENFDSFSLGVVNCSLKDPPEHIPPVEPTICRSIKMEFNNKVRVVRQCGYLTDEWANETSCRRLVGVGEVFVTYCSCDTDLCNGASHNQQMALIGILLLAAATF